MTDIMKAINSNDYKANRRFTVGHPTFNSGVTTSADVLGGPSTDSPTGMRLASKVPFRGEVSSSGASTGVAFRLYRKDESSPYTLGSTEQLVITDYEIVSTSGGEVAIGIDDNASGERLSRGFVAANGGISKGLESPVYCPIGVVPKAYCSVGQVDSTIQGYIATY